MRVPNWLFALLLALPGPLRATEASVARLRIEYTSMPLELDVARPRFSWQLAYQLRVTNEAGQPACY